MGGGGPGTTTTSLIAVLAECSSTYMVTRTRNTQLRVANILLVITADMITHSKQQPNTTHH